MFVELSYNPDKKFWDFPGVDEVIEEIKQKDGDEVAEFYKNITWKDVLEKLSVGVYKFYDCNDPRLDGIEFKDSEWITSELAEKLHHNIYNDQENREIYISHPFGVCDRWEQIFEKIPELKYYKESKEKFVIFLCEHNKKNQPEKDGWRWNKWGPYIGEQNPQREYLYDEPKIEKVYSFHVSRVIETKKRIG